MSILGPKLRTRHPDCWLKLPGVQPLGRGFDSRLILHIHFTFVPHEEVTHPSLSYVSRDSHLITDSYGNVTHFDLPPFADPQTLALHVLNPDVNTCGSTAGTNHQKALVQAVWLGPSDSPEEQYKDG